jgi:hypothetical protein
MSFWHLYCCTFVIPVTCPIMLLMMLLQYYWMRPSEARPPI